MTKFQQMQEDLQKIIQESYEQGTTIERAERLASRFLDAQIAVSSELTKADLESRMRKSGSKAIRAAIYLGIVQSTEKKPTEAQIAATIDTNADVSTEQDALDTAEVSRDELKRLYDVYSNAHIYYRGVAKGAFGG